MDYAYSEQFKLILRIIIAGLCGIVIGLERKNRGKEAGIRTHCVVACASALMMIISKYGFFDLSFSGDFKFDPSRMAQGIVTGVGFLGSGMIYLQRGTLIGLTTASGIWAVSGIGMAIGAGMYTIGISSTFIILFVQLILHSRTKIIVQHKTKNLSVYNVTEDKYEEKIIELLNNLNVIINDISIKKYEGNVYDYTFLIEMNESIKEADILSDIQYECSIDFNN